MTRTNVLNSTQFYPRKIMNTAQWVMLTLGLTSLAFILGYLAAESRERLAALNSERKYRALQNWARDQWPSEYAAHLNAHRMGYQQGVLQGPTLEEDHGGND